MAQHDWHLVDAERDIYCRLIEVDGATRVEMHYPDGTINTMSWEDFNDWRARGGD